MKKIFKYVRDNYFKIIVICIMCIMANAIYGLTNNGKYKTVKVGQEQKVLNTRTGTVSDMKGENSIILMAIDGIWNIFVGPSSEPPRPQPPREVPRPIPPPPAEKPKPDLWDIYEGNGNGVVLIHERTGKGVVVSSLEAITFMKTLSKKEVQMVFKIAKKVINDGVPREVKLFQTSYLITLL